MDEQAFKTYDLNFSNVTDNKSYDVFITGIISVLYSFLILSALVSNSLVILTVIKHKKLQIQENCYVVSLAIADLCIVIVMTFNACNHLFVTWLFDSFMCNLYNSLDVYFSTVSIFHLCCISVDRYFRIKEPLRYPIIMTEKVIKYSLIFIWLVPISISFIPIFMGWHTNIIFDLNSKEECSFKVNKTYSVISSTISFWIPSFTMAYLYYQIYLEAKAKAKQLLLQKRVKTTYRSGNKDISNETCNIEITFNTDNPETHVDLRQEYRAEKTLGITVGIFCTCWTPFFVSYIWTAFRGYSSNNVIIKILYWIGYTNSIFNPMIYSYFNNNFKEEFLDTLKSVCLRK